MRNSQYRSERERETARKKSKKKKKLMKKYDPGRSLENVTSKKEKKKREKEEFTIPGRKNAKGNRTQQSKDR